MTDNQTIDGGAINSAGRTPFPTMRLFYAFAFAIVAWMVVHLIFALAIIQFAVLAVTGRRNEELKTFSFNLVQYLWELLAFVTFVRDEQPFPFGPFPSSHS